MKTQVLMKDKMMELFGDCFGGAEQTRWAIARQRIKRVCKSAQMLGFCDCTTETTYLEIYKAIFGEITLDKIVDAWNIVNFGHAYISKTGQAITKIHEYCRMSEDEFKAAFKQKMGYEYTE